MKLVLFDIDETLIDSAGAGSRAANAAFRDLFGIEEAFAGIPMAGKTDLRILKEGLTAHRLSADNGNLSRILPRYLAHLEREIQTPCRQIKPGVTDALAILDRMEHVLLGLLTGNIERGARIKLDPFGLNPVFPFGAFGDDHEDRDRLLPIAVQKARERTGAVVDPKDCVVVGDTPADVRCARIHGAVAVAVATGPYEEDALVRTGAEHVFSDLTGAMAFFEGLQP